MEPVSQLPLACALKKQNFSSQKNQINIIGKFGTKILSFNGRHILQFESANYAQ